MSDLDNGGAYLCICGTGGVRKISVPSCQFFCKPKIAFKKRLKLNIGWFYLYEISVKDNIAEIESFLWDWGWEWRLTAKELEGNFGDGKVINLKCGYDRKFYEFSKKLLKGTLKWASYVVWTLYFKKAVKIYFTCEIGKSTVVMLPMLSQV